MKKLVAACLKGERPLMDLARALADERDGSISKVLFGWEDREGRARVLVKEAEDLARREMPVKKTT